MESWLVVELLLAVDTECRRKSCAQRLELEHRRKYGEVKIANHPTHISMSCTNFNCQECPRALIVRQLCEIGERCRESRIKNISLRLLYQHKRHILLMFPAYSPDSSPELFTLMRS